MGKKIDWLAVVQGLGMLLVVIGHVSLTNIPGDPNTPIATAIEQTIYTFHMPLFIFISGWLFYHTCIDRRKPYQDMFVSKVKRLAVPFLAFTLATTLLKTGFSAVDAPAGGHGGDCQHVCAVPFQSIGRNVVYRGAV